jgi:extradiol dioxygenase family protein
MLRDKEIVATIAVRDLAKARKFYEGMLGLTPLATDGADVVTYQTGPSKILVYKSAFAGTNRATAATWIVGEEVDELAKKLKNRGVKFEHYEFPDTKLEGDVHVMGEIRTAWFKDPDGNILSLFNGHPVESRIGMQ